MTISKKKYEQEKDAYSISLYNRSSQDDYENSTTNEQEVSTEQNEEVTNNDLSDDEVFSIVLEFWDTACSKVNKNCEYVKNSSVRRMVGTYDAVFYVYIADENAYKYLTIRFTKDAMGNYNFFDAVFNF
jgi:hypothetical protein